MSSNFENAESKDLVDYGREYQPSRKVYVIKKDGSKEAFNVQKVINAVGKSAYRALTKFTEEEKRSICRHVVEKVDIERVLRGMGVQKIVIVNPLELNKAVETVKECAELPGVKAIIFQSPCVAITKPEGYLTVHENCIQCKKCIREIGCPALVLEEGKTAIDPMLCTGCGLCSQICPVDAIGGERHE